MRLTISEQREDALTVLALEGSLVLGDETDALRDRLRKLVKAKRAKIVLVLDKLNRLDSVGVGTMMDGISLTRRAGGDLRLARPSRPVQNVLRLLGFGTRPDLLQIFPDLKAACQSFRAPAAH